MFQPSRGYLQGVLIHIVSRVHKIRVGCKQQIKERCVICHVAVVKLLCMYLVRFVLINTRLCSSLI